MFQVPQKNKEKIDAKIEKIFLFSSFLFFYS